MSLSYRTMPTEQLARWRYPRNPDHYLIRPRVIEREPRPGDIHPLPQSDLRAFLGVVPIDYTYNLRFVELRPRVSEEIGHPYGFYRFKERMIVLYSVPAREWFFPLRLQHYAQGYLKSYRADAEITDMGVRVTWKQPKDLSLFMLHVLFHELGHHYNHQYRCKNSYPSCYSASERSADRHADRLEDDLYRKIMARSR